MMRTILPVTAACLLALPLQAQRAPRLGTIDFPTSGSAAAQPAFVRGVLYLHSFEYPSAITAFREAQRLDPSFAMAYWGEALSYTHPVWNQQDLDSARAALARLAPTREARLARAATPRERAYLDAVEILYGDGSKQRRDTLYSNRMLRMVEEFPDDMEARAFAALSLLGLNQAVRDVPAYMRAAALAEPVFQRNPNHPGAAHYIIHAFDDPVHAPLGLAAARAYSGIAPDAAHAQHMTTHIFLAAGMWGDVVSQNVLAADLTRWSPGHYTHWLGYGLLQRGQYAEARRHLERVRGGMGPGLNARQHLAWMRGDYVINTERWDADVMAWPVNLADGPGAAAYDQFVRGFAAAQRGDRNAATQAKAAMDALIPGARDSLARLALGVMSRQVEGLVQLAEDRDAGLATLRDAAAREEALPVEFGPPMIVKPSRELLGDVLLQLNRPQDAQREYTLALRQAPGRARSLIGLVRAAAAAGDRAVAESAYRTLAANWANADRDLRELAELRPLVAMR